MHVNDLFPKFQTEHRRQTTTDHDYVQAAFELSTPPEEDQANPFQGSSSSGRVWTTPEQDQVNPFQDQANPFQGPSSSRRLRRNALVEDSDDIHRYFFADPQTASEDEETEEEQPADADAEENWDDAMEQQPNSAAAGAANRQIVGQIGLWL